MMMPSSTSSSDVELNIYRNIENPNFYKCLTSGSQDLLKIIDHQIQENKNKVQENKEEIDSLINNESFFSDFKEEFEYFDYDNIMAQQIDYNQNYNVIV